MKIPFRKPNPELKKVTLQDLQQQFNQIMLELGDLNYRKHMMNNEISKLNNEINTRHQKADELGKDAQKLRAAMQAEVAAKVEEGKQLESKKDETVS